MSFELPHEASLLLLRRTVDLISHSFRVYLVHSFAILDLTQASFYPIHAHTVTLICSPFIARGMEQNSEKQNRNERRENQKLGKVPCDPSLTSFKEKLAKAQHTYKVGTFFALYFFTQTYLYVTQGQNYMRSNEGGSQQRENFLFL